MADLSMTPDLRELLGAIADDPRAQLLRVKSHQAAQEGLERNPKVTSSAPFLRKAERRLLELHREELGRLLYAYAHIVRMQVPENELRVHFQDCKVDPPTKEEADRRARALLRTKGAAETEAELLRRCLESTRGLRPAEVVGAALRVAPSDNHFIALGFDLCTEQKGPEGRGVLTAFLDRGLRSRVDSYAWENLGFAATLSGSFEEAAQYYETAIQSDGSRVVPALAWLRFSILAESEDRANRAAAFIDRAVLGASESLAWYRRLAKAGSGVRSSASNMKLAQRVAGRSGPLVREVIDEFE